MELRLSNLLKLEVLRSRRGLARSNLTMDSLTRMVQTKEVRPLSISTLTVAPSQSRRHLRLDLKKTKSQLLK
jgi:hypothetical protein